MVTPVAASGRDVDGDGSPEIVLVGGNTSAVLRVVSHQGALERTITLSGGVPYGSAPALADLTGDGVPEIVVQTDSSLAAYRGDGTLLPGWPQTYSNFWHANSSPVVGDVDGDGRPDIAVTLQQAGSSSGGQVRLYNRLGQLHPRFPKTPPVGAGAVPAIADLDRDGRNELVVTSDYWNGVSGEYDKVWVYDLKSQAPYGSVPWGQFMGNAAHTGTATASPQPRRAPLPDFEGPGTTDVSVFRPSNGTWYVQGSATATTSYGTFGDIPAPGDYDGDGRTDHAVFRPSNGVWYLRATTAGDSAVAYGTSGDVPVAGDYDGDGRAEIAVFRPSQGIWYVKGGTPVSYGTNGDVPVPGDYDGDGRAEMAVFRPSQGVWYVRGTTLGSTAYGTSGDIPVPADFDGDGAADVAVFRPSNGVWYVQGTTAGGSAVAYGTDGDIPVPGDYDGDGRADHGVFRPANGVWFLRASTAGDSATAYGTSGDIPVPAPPAVRATTQ